MQKKWVRLPAALFVLIIALILYLDSHSSAQTQDKSHIDSIRLTATLISEKVEDVTLGKDYLLRFRYDISVDLSGQMEAKGLAAGLGTDRNFDRIVPPRPSHS